MKKYKDYLNKKHSFDKLMMLGIISLIIVISGVFGFVYELIFYYFNEGMEHFYWRGGNFLPWLIGDVYDFSGIIRIPDQDYILRIANSFFIFLCG